MKRRKFFQMLFATAASWPVTSRAQHVVQPRIGVLSLQDPEPFLSGFRAGLRELGYVEGMNIRLEVRSAGGSIERLNDYAADFARNKYDVIATIQNAAAVAAKRATTRIPIVLISSGDPVASGLVADLARPGGNITGMSAATPAGKSLELLAEILPALQRVAAIVHKPDAAFGNAFLDQLGPVAQRLALQTRPVWIGRSDEIDKLVADFRKDRIDAAVLQGSLPLRVAEVALKHRIPTAASSSRFAGTEVLVNYSQDGTDVARKAAAYVDRILKGANPRDLPVQQPTKFELVINTRTARALSVTVPQSVLIRADRVID